MIMTHRFVKDGGGKEGWVWDQAIDRFPSHKYFFFFLQEIMSRTIEAQAENQTLNLTILGMHITAWKGFDNLHLLSPLLPHPVEGEEEDDVIEFW